MAIGIARLFGIKLSQNFNFPYFSRDMLTSGAGGISVYQPGLEITYIFLWEAVKVAGVLQPETYS